VRSLSPGIGWCRQKTPPRLCPRQKFSRQEFPVLTETGSNFDGDWFESDASSAFIAQNAVPTPPVERGRDLGNAAAALSKKPPGCRVKGMGE
jgi:hypothetical protein